MEVLFLSYHEIKNFGENFNFFLCIVDVFHTVQYFRVHGLYVSSTNFLTVSPHVILIVKVYNNTIELTN